MQLTHKIALCPTPEQVDCFRRAGGRPNAMALKKQFNAIRYTDPQWLDENGRPWLQDIHWDAHAQPFRNPAKAWERFFANLRGSREAHGLRLRKKGRCRDSFYVANDRFTLEGRMIRLPRIGEVAMTGELRFAGRILGAMVSRTADRWFVAIQVKVPDAQFYRRRTSHEVNGTDLGIKAAATISSGEVIGAPKPLKAVLRRLEIRSRRLSRKLEAARKAAGFERHARLLEGTRLPVSNNRQKSAAIWARLYARMANIRADFTHRLTTRLGRENLGRENQALVIGDLNFKGMLQNGKPARAISDVGFGMLRPPLECKVRHYGTCLAIADRWYPGGRRCSICGGKNEVPAWRDRTCVCAQCGARHILYTMTVTSMRR